MVGWSKYVAPLALPMSKPAGARRATPSGSIGSGFWYLGEGAGDKERSENVVVGDSVPDLGGDDFHPKSAPSLLGDLGCLSDRRLSSESVRWTPSSCKFKAGEGCAPIMDVSSRSSRSAEEYSERVSILARDGFCAWEVGCS